MSKSIYELTNELDDKLVYDMLEGIFANISTVKASHNTADANIDISFGIGDLELPLHPGAEQFWKDKGFTK